MKPLNNTQKPRFLICLPEGEQAELLKAIGLCQGYEVEHLSRGWIPALEALSQGAQSAIPTTVCLDLDELNRKRFAISSWRSNIEQNSSEGRRVRLFLSRDSAVVSPAQRLWAIELGCEAFIPSLSKIRMKSQLASEVGAELTKIFGPIRWDRLTSFLALLPQGLGRTQELQFEHRCLHAIEEQGTNLEQLLQWAKGSTGFSVQDRTYHLRRYASCFIGVEACEAISKRFKVTSEAAICLGRLIQKAGAFEHVTFEHPFESEMLFYRFVQAERPMPSLHTVLKVLLKDVRCSDRRYLGKTYQQCFLGAEAADVVAKHFDVSHEQATIWIRQLAALGQIEHVVKEHEFKPSDNFYEFSGLAIRKDTSVSIQA